MTTEEANEEVYRRLLSACSLRLLGDPRYPVPLDTADQQRRHPGQGYETIGLVWQKQQETSGAVEAGTGQPARGEAQGSAA